MSPLARPLDYPNIRQVNSFEELLHTPFGRGVNALCWPRVLCGDFAQVVTAVAARKDGVQALAAEDLSRLVLDPAGTLAAEAMITDLARLREQGLEPELNCITAYPRAAPPVPTDVYSFHVDRAPVETDTWLCTYYGLPSEGLRNEDAHKCIDVGNARALLLQQFGGTESPEFETYLREHCYDLHYAPTPGALPWSFGVGHLWRIAVQWPGCPALPCIHRAPADIAGQLRLLLIS